VLVDDHLAIVASGDAGFGLTGPLDCHAYLVTAGGTRVLVDAGAGPSVDATLERLRWAGCTPGDLTAIFLTHHHADHAGGACALAEATGAPVWSSAYCADVLAEGDEERSGMRRARELGVYPPGYRLPTLTGIRVLADGDALNFDGVQIEAVATPGHAAGHLSFLVTDPARTLLLAGDAVFSGGRVLLQEQPDVSVADAAASCRRLAARDFDALLPGHGAFRVRGGRAHVEHAARTFDRGLVPPNVELGCS
jgi:hydroxyacylglutathione hydrolase